MYTTVYYSISSSSSVTSASSSSFTSSSRSLGAKPESISTLLIAGASLRRSASFFFERIDVRTLLDAEYVALHLFNSERDALPYVFFERLLSNYGNRRFNHTLFSSLVVLVTSAQQFNTSRVGEGFRNPLQYHAGSLKPNSAKLEVSV